MDFPDLLAAPTVKVGKNTKHEVIDLSNRVIVDDDELLDELLVDDHPMPYNAARSIGRTRTEVSDAMMDSPTPAYYSNKYNSSYPASPTSTAFTSEYLEEEESYDEKLEYLHEQVDGEYYEEQEEEEDDEESDTESTSSETTATLLERAHDRLHMQDLQDEIERLQAVIKRKNTELDNLAGQLRRAVATKCDLVLAHNELEVHHEQNLKRRDEGLMQLKRANLGLLEAQSEVEKDLLNEIITLTEKAKDMEQKHRAELGDWERLHKNEVAEKDFKIAQLREEIRLLKNGSKKPSSFSSIFKKG